MKNSPARTGHQRGMGGRWTDDDDTHERHTDTNKLTRHTLAKTPHFFKEKPNADSRTGSCTSYGMHDDTDQNGARLSPAMSDHVDRMVRPGVRSIVRYLGDRLGGSQAIAVWRALEKESANHSSLGRQLLQVLGGRLRGSPVEAQARLMDYARALIDPQFSGLRAVAERLHASDKSTARALCAAMTPHARVHTSPFHTCHPRTGKKGPPSWTRNMSNCSFSTSSTRHWRRQ